MLNQIKIPLLNTIEDSALQEVKARINSKSLFVVPKGDECSDYTLACGDIAGYVSKIEDNFVYIATLSTHYGISLINYVGAGIKIGARLLTDGTIKLQLELIN